MIEFWRDVVPTVFVVIGLIVTLGALMFGVAYLGITYDCGKFSEATGMPTKMAGTVCYAEIDGAYVPRDAAIERRLRIREVK